MAMLLNEDNLTSQGEKEMKIDFSFISDRSLFGVSIAPYRRLHKPSVQLVALCVCVCVCVCFTCHYNLKNQLYTRYGAHFGPCLEDRSYGKAVEYSD